MSNNFYRHFRLTSVLYSLKTYKFSDETMITFRYSLLFYIKNESSLKNIYTVIK